MDKGRLEQQIGRFRLLRSALVVEERLVEVGRIT